MKEDVNFSTFTDRFNSIRPDNFSYRGLKALYEYLLSYEEDCDTEIELDVIALCCDYSQYADLEAFKDNYGAEYTMDTVYDATVVIPLDNEAFIIQDF